jgi:hypothetical protein
MSIAVSKSKVGPGSATGHQVWLPYHWGHVGLVTGDAVNDLFCVVADPNVFIQESKGATCDVRPGPHAPGARNSSRCSPTCVCCRDANRPMPAVSS